jgi:hypothetical protein
MDSRTSLRSARGSMLLEVVVCLAVLALVLSAFGEQFRGTMAAEAQLAERGAAERTLQEIRALLRAEDPFAGPDTRTYTAVGGIDASATAAILCSGPTLPPDNSLQPPRCANGARAVRRWTIRVAYPSSSDPATSDTLRALLDVGAPAAGSTWTTAGVAR